MEKKPAPTSRANYRIVLQGKIPAFREQWFDGMQIQYADGNSVLSGELLDQAALHGVLEKIRDLGLTLLSVNKMESTT